ncbi:MAG TPA: group II intron reverse transcriptase/maturase [Terriglobia bacterium]|nr:group II intron reverse transcriptase/maturase [Terriglobia bacterium]
MNHTINTNVAGESDERVVPAKCPNKGEPGSQGDSAEDMEGSRSTKRNAEKTHTLRTQGRAGVSQGLGGVREAAGKDRKQKFTALLHHVTREQLQDSYGRLKKEAAPGVDGVTWREYGEGVEGRIRDLHDRIHRGAYRAQPSQRRYIPKLDGRQRPLGIAALEDKIVQQAVVTVLNEVYEEDFMGFSYGFRPGRSQHDALDALTVGLKRRKVSWVLDADIRGFFDHMNHEWLMKFVQHRIADRRILRLIQKWLKAGVSEEGKWQESKEGTPQGAVISPLLANVYLHYVFDLWANQWRKQRAQGDMIIVRYADDIVLGFQHRKEAEAFLEQMGERMQKFGLELHPEKTRLIEFGRFAESNRKQRGEGKPETFDFLGFTHACGKTRKGGWFTVKRWTIKKRWRNKLQAIKQELRKRWHENVTATGEWLKMVLRGYYNYHAVPGNLPALRAFRREVAHMWRRWLRRRSQRNRITRPRFNKLLDRYFPNPRILHPYPWVRFDARYSR